MRTRGAIVAIATSALVAGMMGGCSSKASVPEAATDLASGKIAMSGSSVGGENVGATPLITPHVSATLRSRRITTQLTASDAQRADLPLKEGLKAAAGQELLAADIDLGQPPYDPTGEPPTYFVRAGSTVREIGSFGLPDYRASPHLVLVFSVTQGQPAAFGIQDAGRRMWIDLRKGTLIKDAGTRQSASFATSTNVKGLGSGVLTSKTVLGYKDLFGYPTRKTLNITFEVNEWSARRLPWIPGKLWAPTGRDWLVLTTSGTTASIEQSNGTFSVDSSSVKVQADGAVIGPSTSGGDLTEQAPTEDGPSIAYSIPHGSRSITLVIKPVYFVALLEGHEVEPQHVRAVSGPSTVRTTFELP